MRLQNVRHARLDFFYSQQAEKVKPTQQDGKKYIYGMFFKKQENMIAVISVPIVIATVIHTIYTNI